VIESAAGELQTGGNIFCFKDRQFFKDLLLRETGGQQIEYIDDSNPHPTDTGTPTTLLRVDRDAFDKFGHAGCFPDRNHLGYSAEQPDPVILKVSLLKRLIIINQSVQHGVIVKDFSGMLVFRPPA